MSKTIRQQTHLRSVLADQAGRGLGKARIRVMESNQGITRPDWSFMLDGTACTDDALTTRFPRTAREAFGHYACGDALPKRITFLSCYHDYPRGVALVAALFVVAFLVGWGWK